MASDVVSALGPVLHGILGNTDDPGRDNTISGRAHGTATSRKGKERVQSILESAKQTLLEDGHAQFSLRNVAQRAGIHLRNLQYYFPTRDRLIHGLCDYIAEEYGNRLSAHLSTVGDDPLEQFEAAIDFYLSDVQQLEARRWSMNEWALLSAMDEYEGHKLNEYYAERFSNRFVPLVRALNPSLSRSDVAARSKIIAAIIEGMLIMIDRSISSRQEVNRLLRECKRQLTRIASES